MDSTDLKRRRVAEALDVLRKGTVIPAHPLVLDEDRQFDPAGQSSVTKYYLDAGVGGIAVGVHTTQFAIREHGLYEPVLAVTAETTAQQDRDVVLVAGVTGATAQAVQEARIARSLGYHAALLNLAALRGQSERDILTHCRTVGEEIAIIGFALLPEVGGFHLSVDFWREFCSIESVVAIKMAPFNRYRTLDIVRAVVEAEAEERITLYTGNDDHIVLDLLAPFVVRRGSQDITVRIKGGLLGHWSVWTKRAVELLSRIHSSVGKPISEELLALDSIITDSNGAIYDAHNDFAGCIPGCLEVLRRQGLVRGTWCLDPALTLSLGQLEQIDRVYESYPLLNDDEFVAQNLDRWMTDRKTTEIGA